MRFIFKSVVERMVHLLHQSFSYFACLQQLLIVFASCNFKLSNMKVLILEL